jgi:hypothetical protein
MTGIDIHSVVALLEDADDNGKTYAMVALKAQRLIRDCFLVARARVNRPLSLVDAVSPRVSAPKVADSHPYPGETD